MRLLMGLPQPKTQLNFGITYVDILKISLMDMTDLANYIEISRNRRELYENFP
jgi:hypothetical protein